MEPTPDAYKQIKIVFNKALELSDEDRASFLLDSGLDPDMHEEVRRMLEAAADDRSGLEQSAFGDLTEDILPDTIGEYKIVREIGRGGMGAVYEALRETAAFSQKAALKVIRREMNSETISRRFRSEQKILAKLEHPNIARFLDGGKTVGNLPFYAMEYVDGVPIDDYCRSIPLNEKIILFRQVCAAVSYAHSQLVVHRDLKPSNIVVTKDGTPKLLDFGIAKVLEAESDSPGTATQLGMMTPQYASPEQVRGENVTTLSDVYSLGVILYELVTGLRPYKTDGRNYAEILEIVTQTEPVKPSGVVRLSEGQPRLRTEIDSIILKSLQKDPARRYASVEQMSEDLRRFVAGLPISARPDTVGYRLRKFAARNRVGVAAAAIVLLTLIIGISATTWQAVRAERLRLLAEKRFAEVRNLANNVVFKYHDEIAKLDGSTAVRQMLVTDAIAYLDNLSADAGNDADLQRELALAYLKLGDVQGKLYAANTGNTNAASESYRKAVDLLEHVVAARPDDMSVKDDLLAAYDSHAALMARTLTHPQEKKAVMDKAAKTLGDILAAKPNDARHRSQLAGIYIRYGDSIGAVEYKSSLLEKLDYHLKALPLAEEVFAADANNPENMRLLARVNQRLGTDYVWLGENAELNGQPAEAQVYFSMALPHHQKMNETIERLVAAVPSDPGNRRFHVASLSSYSETLARNNQGEKALEVAGESLTLARENQARDPNNREASFDIAASTAIFAKIYQITGDDARAINYIKQALAISEDVVSADKGNFEMFARIGEYHVSLIGLYKKHGDMAQAAYYEQKLETHRRFVDGLKDEHRSAQ